MRIVDIYIAFGADNYTMIVKIKFLMVEISLAINASIGWPTQPNMGSGINLLYNTQILS